MLRSPSFSALSAKIMYFMCAWLSPAKAAFRFSVVFGPMMFPSCWKWLSGSNNVHQQVPDRNGWIADTSASLRGPGETIDNGITNI
jgi:hypothetical protein